MSYTPTVYVDGQAPDLSATNLNHNENGLQAAAAVADAASTLATAALPTPAGTDGQFLKRVGGVWVPTSFAVSDIPAVYATYTPTWTSSGTAPAIGNAVVVARYLQVGKLVHCYGQITFGSTSTFGTGTYTFALPVAASSTTLRALGAAELFHNSTIAYYLATGSTTLTTKIQFLFPTTFGGAITQVGQTTPWTWATSDFISWNFTYEAA